ncbi:porin [Dichotomicrobium thermohalophilum]|uniref:Porin n=1 Tax=Dichotomicrobium thermohalophilum TaxID=933063 RepID=A0A397PDM3_9HYPH|nr:hypothetical protein [Dichotomicrobium thermohalophilum]RIA47596.1 hypothetical protein BXY53_2153 [Dichotomicrobium thermohalophilum]
MIGGLMKTSHYALAAAAGLFVGALAFTPAKAADLGGDCCADLEERVAELEATTVRKGNRVVSVQLYGQVNKALFAWDDGVESDLYVVDSDISSTRFGFRGSGTIDPGWTAGYRIEIEMQSAPSNEVSQDYAGLPGDDGVDGEGDIATRRASVYVDSDRFGRATMGLTSSATDDLVYTYLGSVNVTGAEFFGGGLRVRTSDGGFAGTNIPFEQDFTGSIALSDIATDTDIGRWDGVRYDSPSLYGFILSAAWGESDNWDVALRFKQEWNSIQFVAAAGYRYEGDTDKSFFDGTRLDGGDAFEVSDKESLILAAGIKHVPSGIFLNGVWVQQDRDELDAQIVDQALAEGVQFDGAAITDADARFAEDSATYWQVFGGIEKNWTGYGLTSFFGRYISYEGFGAGQYGYFGLADGVVATDEDNINGFITDSEVNVWGFGIEQDYDAAALEFYAHYNYWEVDSISYRADTDPTDDTTDPAQVENGKVNGLEDMWTAYLGTRIKF